MKEYDHTDDGSYCLTVSSVDFGWGGSGALGAILASYRRHWNDTRIGVIGSHLGKNILPRKPIAFEAATLKEAVSAGRRPHVHLSVLDSDTAKSAVKLGIRTVFVDLLPFLWGKEQREWVPYDVDQYLFQDVPGMGHATEILPAKAISIEAIIDQHHEPLEHCSRGKGYALLVLGGLISPQQNDRDGYVRAVTSSVVQAIRAHGYRVLRVIGNLSPKAAHAVTQLCTMYGVESHVGYVDTAKFSSLVDSAELILAQPGLMTLLEASASSRPLVRLPPQNVAGFVQTAGFSRIQGTQAAISWPDGTVDTDYLENLRAEGESIANSYCYSALNAFTSTVLWENDLFYESLIQAIDEAFSMSPTTRRRFATLTGEHGALQAAQYVRQEIKRTV